MSAARQMMHVQMDAVESGQLASQQQRLLRWQAGDGGLEGLQQGRFVIREHPDPCKIPLRGRACQPVGDSAVHPATPAAVGRDTLVTIGMLPQFANQQIERVQIFFQHRAQTGLRRRRRTPVQPAKVDAPANEAAQR